MKLVKELPIPAISLTQKVTFGILFAMEIYDEPGFVRWAERWLSGKDRSAPSAFIICATICKTPICNEETKLFGMWLASRATYAAYSMARAGCCEKMVSQTRGIVTELIDAITISRIDIDLPNLVSKAMNY